MKRRAWKAPVVATLAMAVTFAAAPVQDSEQETDQHRSESVAVEVVAPDGFMLAARLYAAAERGPGVLLLHQGDREGPKTGYESLAAKLASQGMHAMVLDFRGYGGSVNEQFTGKNWQQAQRFFEGDVTAALAYLAKRDEVDATRLGVIGASIGGRHATIAARNNEALRAMCLISANLGRDVDVTMNGLDDRAVMCIAAEDDPYANAAATAQEAFALSNHEASRLIILKGTAHGTPLFKQAPDFESTIADWMKRVVRSARRSS